MEIGRTSWNEMFEVMLLRDVMWQTNLYRIQYQTRKRECGQIVPMQVLRPSTILTNSFPASPHHAHTSTNQGQSCLEEQSPLPPEESLVG